MARCATNFYLQKQPSIHLPFLTITMHDLLQGLPLLFHRCDRYGNRSQFLKFGLHCKKSSRFYSMPEAFEKFLNSTFTRYNLFVELRFILKGVQYCKHLIDFSKIVTELLHRIVEYRFDPTICSVQILLYLVPEDNFYTRFPLVHRRVYLPQRCLYYFYIPSSIIGKS